MRYLLTFSCYGHRLHGDPIGTVDKQHCVYGGRFAPGSAARLAYVRRLMNERMYELDGLRRKAVLRGMREGARRRGWRIWAAHVRENHVHVVVEGQDPPEMILAGLKAYASCELSPLDREGERKRRWARHGSTRWLWKDRDFHESIVYVADLQGDPMEVYVDPEW